MNFCHLGLSVIEIEAQAVFDMSSKIDHNFEQACKLLLTCQGRVVVTGMGKSGHIANKIAATLSSTGTPAFFMHAGEASHGDLGMITPRDVVVAISYSGNTFELVTLLPLLKNLKVPLIILTGNSNSKLAQSADVVLDIHVKQEACPLGLAPTTSTTVSLVLGDALAIALLQARGFSAADFALAHPGGILGKRLTLRADEISHKADELPMIIETATVSEALIEVTAKKLGMTCVINDEGLLSGIFTDGDIRRTLIKKHDINTTQLKEVMSHSCKTITKETLAVDALTLMQNHCITSLVIVEDKKPRGVIHFHDLHKAGLF